MKKPTFTQRVFGLTLVLLSLIGAAVLAPGSTRIASAQVVTSWTYTGTLNTPRCRHTATLLPDGKVLVAGGRGAAGSLDSAELYDPDTGTWSVTGSLNVSRDFSTATLLLNGKVLVAGGYHYVPISSGSGVTNSAELYDPATRTWSLTGKLNAARVGHTATLLPDGRVLVAGGWGGPNNGPDTTNSAELYDPATGAWSLTGNFNIGREFHTATLLQDGKVLVAAGATEDDYNPRLDSTELYDPNTGTWSVTGRLNANRGFHTATLLPDGNVLVAGGEGFPCSGGFCYSTVNNSAELYNPATGTWSYTGSLSRRAAHSATIMPNGQVLVAGGGDFAYDNMGHGAYLNSAEFYDPVAGKWNKIANLNATRESHTATLLSNGKVLIAGGSANNTTLNTAELYDPNAPIPTPKIISASVVGKSLVVLGENFDSGAMILINGEEQATKNDRQSLQTTLIGKKAGKKIKPGDKLQVRNSNGTLSEDFIFTGS